MADSMRDDSGPDKRIEPDGPPEGQAIELRAFMGLSDFFRERNWPNPKKVALDGETTGLELLAMLGLAPEQVEVIFVNGKACSPSLAVLSGGDRVALAPPGVPGPYRVLLGFKKMGS